MTTLVAVPDPADTSGLLAQSSALVLDATAVSIVDDASYEEACGFGLSIKTTQKTITEFFAPRKKRWHEGHAAECADEKKLLEPTLQAEGILKAKIIAYRQVKLEAEMKLRREREAEALRLEQERQLQQALDAEADGDHAAAEEIMNQEVVAPVVRMEEVAPKVAGVAAPKRWTFDEQRVDFEAVLLYIVTGSTTPSALAHPELVSLAKLDPASVRRAINLHREAFKVPGIRAYQEEGVSFRGAK